MAQRMVRQMVLKPWSWVRVTRVSCEGGIVGGATNFFFFLMRNQTQSLGIYWKNTNQNTNNLMNIKVS